MCKPQDISAFLTKHKIQIGKIASQFCLNREDVQQEIALFILARGNEFDASKGTFEGFVFGHIRELLKRQTFGALRYAVSIDDRATCDVLDGLEADHEPDYCTEKRDDVPGIEKLISLAEVMSGKTAVDVAKRMTKTKRCINYKLARDREWAKVQFALF